MTLPDLHLAGEALAALVDGELGVGAYDRAMNHLVRCADCRSALAFQREAKAVLAAGTVPAMPEGLVARLHEVPMTADLGPGGPGTAEGSLVLAGELLLWGGSRTAVRVTPPVGPTTPERPSGTPKRRDDRPRRHRSWRGHGPLRMRSQRLRRGVAGALAGMAVGVLGAASPGGGQSFGQTGPGGAAVTGRQVVPASVVNPGLGRNRAPARVPTRGPQPAGTTAPGTTAPGATQTHPALVYAR
jgi:hypothetical protein